MYRLHLVFSKNDYKPKESMKDCDLSFATIWEVWESGPRVTKHKSCSSHSLWLSCVVCSKMSAFHDEEVESDIGYIYRVSGPRKSCDLCNVRFMP